MLSEVLSSVSLWQKRLKVIGGKFGTSVLSYFNFLRWLLKFNIFSFIVTFSFIIIPQFTMAAANTLQFTGLEFFTGAVSSSLPAWASASGAQGRPLLVPTADLSLSLGVNGWGKWVLNASLLPPKVTYTQHSRLAASRGNCVVETPLLCAHSRHVHVPPFLFFNKG